MFGILENSPKNIHENKFSYLIVENIRMEMSFLLHLFFSNNIFYNNIIKIFI